MNAIWEFLFLLAGAAGTGWLAWISVQSFRQGRMLSALPNGLVGALEGQTLAARGKVKVLRPLNRHGVGPCLWSRETEEERRFDLLDLLTSTRSSRRDWRTLSDHVAMADFALVVDGQEIAVEALPTEIQDTCQTVDRGDSALLGGLFGGRDYRRRVEWLPIREELTVIGRLERRVTGRALVVDPALGLLFSPNPPDQAGRIETMKALAGFAGVLLAGGVTGWLLFRILSRT